jgi:transposase InsO family protein
MSLRKEFVTLAFAEGADIRQLRRRFSISPTTGYKWLKRYQGEGEIGLTDRSRRPHSTPARTPKAVEEVALAVRDAHPTWGGRKLRAVLAARGLVTPAASTVTAILKRHGRIDPAESVKHHRWQRFEHQSPNQLWQMDFKGHFPVGEGRCHPLTVLDDHSRFALAIEDCPDEQTSTVQSRLITIFRRYGLPERMLMDNGSPWGDDPEHPYRDRLKNAAFRIRGKLSTLRSAVLRFFSLADVLSDDV